MPIQKINKTELIVKSIEVFNKMGYTHTSMTDLAKSVGLQKGSIYHYFESKEQLLRHCIYFSKEFLSDQVFHIAYQDDLLPEVRMELIFNKLAKIATRNYQGCFFGNLSLEISSMELDVNTLLHDFFEELKSTLSYILKVNLSAEAALERAEEIIYLYEGAVMMAKLRKDQEPIVKVVSIIKTKVK